MEVKTLGLELVSVVKEALAIKESGKIARPKSDVAVSEKN
jgi:hypothetical protein